MTQSDRGGSAQGHRYGNEQEGSDLFDPLPSDHLIEPEIPDHNMADDEFPDEDFDDLPLDELDDVIFQECANVPDSSAPQNNNRITGNPNRATKPHTLNGSGSLLGSSNSRSVEPSHESEFVANNESDFMDDDMDCFITEIQSERTGGAHQLPVQQGPSRGRESATNKTDTSGSSGRLTSDSSKSVSPQGQSCTSSTALTLTSPPFTYLCFLEEMMSKPHKHTTKIHVKAFIVTLLGRLSSSNGLWRICASISDGTGYLDVELSDEVLTGLLGFSVAEKGALKRDPARRGELDTGMMRCQQELVDMCCVMTIEVEAEGRKAVVTKAQPVDEKVLQELEQRVRDGRK